LVHLRSSLADRRALGALLFGNFVVVPALVWGLSRLLPEEPSLALGFFLVMLVPCTDWYVTFTQLGHGDGRLALASTPLLLVAQLAVLPLLLRGFLGPGVADALRAEPFVTAFVGVIVAPLVLAALLERAASVTARGRAWLARSALAPVPLLGAVLFVITASEISGILDKAGQLKRVVGLFVVYAGAIPFIGLALARRAGLRGPQARTVLFSLGTRNSFVVLPLALAWPGADITVAAVVVVQSFVELAAMTVYLGVLPRLPLGE
jgi:ACR3 family arsenite efflux pump ArsB